MIKSKAMEKAQRGAVKRREAKQERSLARQQIIAQAAIAAISRYGIAGLTHRRVAHEANVSLAATTYYYQTKNDIIEHASIELLEHTDKFWQLINFNDESLDGVSMLELSIKMIANALGREKDITLSWCEIILNAANKPKLQIVARSWFSSLNDTWQDIARQMGIKEVGHAATSAIDMIIGFIFLLLPLALSEKELREMLYKDASEFDPELGSELEGPPVALRTGNKAEATRERILRAAVDILTSGQDGGITFRSVAEKSGLTIAAPTYHFPSVSSLLNAAQNKLFIESKLRYRKTRGMIDYKTIDVQQIANLTTMVFYSEATEFRGVSLAALPVYIQSSRDPMLRQGLWAINVDQWQGWSRVIKAITPSDSHFNAWLMYAVFVGKLIRTISSGVGSHSLIKARSEFFYELGGLADGSHWTKKP